MKVTCGTDIIEIERIKKAIERGGERFLNTVFTENEIKYCEERKVQRYQHYAARFAAKEAAFKAVSKEIDDSYWKMFEVIKDEKGRPEIKICCDIQNLESIDLSLSHCKDYAIANVVAVFKEEK